MKARYGLLALVFAAGALAAGELAVTEFDEPSGWVATGKRNKSGASGGSGPRITGAGQTYKKALQKYPLGGMENLRRPFTGIVFKVKGDGSTEWGCIAVEAGPRDGGLFYFPLKNKETVEYRVAFSDMAPRHDHAGLPAAKIAAGEITGFSVGDKWGIGQNNYPRKPFSYEVSDLRLADDIKGRFVPGKFRLAPIDGVIAKMKAKQPVLILCFGDSITAGVGLRDREKERYATVLQGLLRQKYGYDGITVRSVAVGGAHTYHTIGWLDRDLAQGNPDAATMLIGFNSRSASQSAAEYAEQLSRWIELFAMKTGGKAAVVLIPTVQGVPRFFAQQDMADATYEVGKRYGIPVAPLDKAIAKLGPEEYRKTCLPRSAIHPNEAGHKLFAEVLLPVFCK